MKKIIEKIKKKKELSDLPDYIVEDTLNNYLKTNKIQIPKNPKQQKILIKEIRSKLRELTGRYQSTQKTKKRAQLLNNIPELLKTHTSTSERLPDYHKLKNLITKLNPNSILDLGCGLNPIAISSSKIYYYAYDIKQQELELIQKFFKKNKIPGHTKAEDIRKVKNFPNTDLTLIFKTLDIIDNKYHTHTKNILQKIPSKKILVSFSTRTLSGKKMRSPQRKWFEALLEKLNYTYTIPLKTHNEIFYLIEKPELRPKSKKP